MWVDGVSKYPSDRTAQQVTPEDIAASDFVLAFERDHRSALVAMYPAARARIFTFVEAASLAEAVVADGQALDIALGKVTPTDDHHMVGSVLELPSSLEGRAQWFATEMNANRGLVSLDVIPNATLTVDGESIIDPLFVKANVHPAVANLTVAYADRWAAALQACLSA
jgi:protein-tyrosine-phosphatase